MEQYKEAVLVLAGDPPRRRAAALLQALSARDDVLRLAADGGADAYAALGITPHVILGDGDSISTRAFAAVPRVPYDVRKDFTDGEAALRYACEQVPGKVWLFGAMGGRADHFLADIFLPLHAADDPTRVQLADDSCNGYYSTGAVQLQGKPGDLLSLIPLTAIEGLSLQGLEYPLADFDLPMGSSRTVSNVLADETVTVTHRSGVLLVLHFPA